MMNTKGGHNMKCTEFEVWGLAAGRKSTKYAARGAFTWQRYKTPNFDKTDWLMIVSVKEVMK